MRFPRSRPAGRRPRRQRGAAGPQVCKSRRFRGARRGPRAELATVARGRRWRAGLEAPGGRSRPAPPIPTSKAAPRRSRRKLALIGAAAAVAARRRRLVRLPLCHRRPLSRLHRRRLCARRRHHAGRQGRRLRLRDRGRRQFPGPCRRRDRPHRRRRLPARRAMPRATRSPPSRPRIGRIGQQITAAQAAVAQARAQLASARAVETRTDSELKRQQALADKAFASRQTLEQAQSNRDQAVAAVQSAQAAHCQRHRQCRRAGSAAAGSRAAAQRS